MVDSKPIGVSGGFFGHEEVIGQNQQKMWEHLHAWRQKEEMTGIPHWCPPKQGTVKINFDVSMMGVEHECDQPDFVYVMVY